MPLRTVMTSLCCFGPTRTLYIDDNWMRYYQGFTAAAVPDSISRFEDTATAENVYTLAFLKPNIPPASSDGPSGPCRDLVRIHYGTAILSVHADTLCRRFVPLHG
ncbi:hypothetical protein V8D89_014908 [Ganoderma adspersum]